MRVGWLAFVFVPAIALADQPVPSPAHIKMRGSSTPLLGGQIQAVLPIDMKLEPVEATNSIGVNPSWRDEARYALQVDDVSFVMMAYETYTSVGSDFHAGVTVDLKTQGDNLGGAQLKKLTFPKPFVAYEVLPRVPKSSYDARTLIYAAYIGDLLGTVQVLAFYVAPEGLPYADAWIALARRISMSVVLGKPLDVKAGAHRLGDLIVTTPDAWAASTQIASEVSVIVQQLRKIVPLGKDGPSCSMQWSGAFASAPDGAATVPDTLLGEPVTWNEWSDRDGAYTRTILPRGTRNSDTAVTCHAASRDELPALRKMFGSLRVSGKPRHTQ